MPFYLKKGDLVAAECDAIVNASNVNLKMVEGVGRAIFHKAGDQELARACKAIGRCNVGKAVLTPSFNMTNCKGIIHAVGPIYINGKHNEEPLLRSAYVSSLNICLEQGYKSVAFPLLSGEFNYPLSEAYEIAQDECLKFLKQHEEFTIYLIIFKNFPELIEDSIHTRLKNFIIDNFDAKIQDDIKTSNLEFVSMVNEFMKAKNIDKDRLIQKSNILPSLLEKIENDSSYIPSKNFVLAVGVGLELNENEILKLFNSVGYKSLTNSVISLVVLFFIKEKNYDVFTINRALFSYEAKPLGSE